MHTTFSKHTDAFAGPGSAHSACECAFFAEESSRLYLSSAKPEIWTRGLLAVGLGTALAISVYCGWQVWNILTHAH
jgi:hypothetical protein